MTILTGFTGKGTAAQLELQARFLRLPSPAGFRRHLERMTGDPHPSGSDASRAVAEALGA